MTAIGLNAFHDLDRNDDIPYVAPTDSTSPLAAIVDGVRVAIARYRYRRTIESLAHFHPHVLRDMGFEPGAVYDAANGDWSWLDARGRRG